MHDVVVVGGGIVGLATAYRTIERWPDLRLTVVEKEAEVGLHQSQHNSGVLHAGLYYKPGSLKARLCRIGKEQMEEFAAAHNVPFRRLGKLVIASTKDEERALAILAERAQANGVPGARLVSSEEIQEIEPHAVGTRGLHSPQTGVIDYQQVCLALRDEIQKRGAEVRLSWPVIGMQEHLSDVVVTSHEDQLRTRTVISCGGLHSDRLMALMVKPSARIVPFRGAFLRLRAGATRLVKGSIYPVPDPRYPFLGVHFTRRLDDSVWVGPNAVVALGRETYNRGIAPRDVADMLRFGGFWRLASRHIATGARELIDDRIRRIYFRKMTKYIPALEYKDLEAGPSGIRAQLISSKGDIVDDFELSETRRVVHLLNAPSPAATASLAIGSLLADKLEERLW